MTKGMDGHCPRGLAWPRTRMLNEASAASPDAAGFDKQDLAGVASRAPELAMTRLAFAHVRVGMREMMRRVSTRHEH